jgi:HD-like signal output (HDOD) protein
MMRRWLAQLLGRRAPVASAGPGPLPAAEPAEAQRQRPRSDAPARPPAAERPPEKPLTDEDCLATLGLEPLEPPDPSDQAAEARAHRQAEDELVATRILVHFDQHRPAPSSMPQVALRILNLVAEPEVDPSELAQLVSRDPAIAAGVLRLANSAAYPSVGHAETVREAIGRVGLRELARVAGTVSAGALFNPKLRAEYARFGPLFQQQFEHATATAMSAASLAMARPKARSDRTFLAGLLHDVGKSVALRSLAALSETDGALRALDEERVLRVVHRVHCEIGGEVHQGWALPSFATVIAVRHHDREVPEGDEFLDLHLVRLSSALQLCNAGSVHEELLRDVVQSAKALRLSRFELRSFDAEARQLAQRAALFARAPGAAAPPPPTQRPQRGRS